MLFFQCIDKLGECRNCSVGGLSIEDSFHILTNLVARGEQLIQVELKTDYKKSIFLPVAAFDGLPMKEPIKSLQLEWEEILAV